jgi:hypothetical protein
MQTDPAPLAVTRFLMRNETMSGDPSTSTYSHYVLHHPLGRNGAPAVSSATVASRETHACDGLSLPRLFLGGCCIGKYARHVEVFEHLEFKMAICQNENGQTLQAASFLNMKGRDKEQSGPQGKK